jgi:hypothetical protein
VAALDKIVKLAESFNADWTAGKFDSARAVFESLDSAVQQVISDLNINASPQAKLLLASVGIGVRSNCFTDCRSSSEPATSNGKCSSECAKDC